MSETNPTSGDPKPSSSRPEMPGSYGIQHTSQGIMPWDDVRERLTNARNYWVGTTRPDGRPHAVPVWGVWLDETFFFATDRASRKGRNLGLNQGLVVHLESGDDVVILEGTAEEVTEDSALARFVDAYEGKYQVRPDPQDPAHIVYKLLPRAAYAWLESDFPNTATRWFFDD